MINLYEDQLIDISEICTDFAAEIGYDFITVEANIKDMAAYHFVDIVAFDVSFYYNRYQDQKQLDAWYKNNNFDFGRLHLGTIALLHEFGHLIDSSFYDDEELSEKLNDYGDKVSLIKEGDIDTYKQLEPEAEADHIAQELYYRYGAAIQNLEKEILRILGI